MTGIDSWSTSPATNATADGGSVNWAEGQAPSTVNNTARQQAADVRSAFNDLIWFQYGTGDQGSGNLATPAVYASGTSFTITGSDVTLVFHARRRVRAVGSGTGTIYGAISSSSYNGGNTTTTVNVTWDSGSLSNETLVISLSQIPATGSPAPVINVLEANATGVSCAITGTAIATVTLTPGRWRLSGNVAFNGGGSNATCTIAINSTSGSIAGTSGKTVARFAVNTAAGVGLGSLAGFDVTVAANTAYYLNGAPATGSDTLDGYIRAERIG